MPNGLALRPPSSRCRLPDEGGAGSFLGPARKENSMDYQKILKQLAILRRRSEAEHDLVRQNLEGKVSAPMDSVSRTLGQITGSMSRDDESTSA